MRWTRCCAEGLRSDGCLVPLPACNSPQTHHALSSQPHTDAPPRLPLPQMWKYEGSRTLSYYLRRRDTLQALAEDMDVPEEAVAAVAMKQLVEGLAVRVGCCH